GDFNGYPFIAMELIEGKTLRQICTTSRPALPQCLDAMRQVAAGMQAIHSMGIVHRDLSMNNIMLTEAGTAKILDLGLAKDVSRMTSTASQYMLVGTLSYIAPELVEGKPA